MLSLCCLYSAMKNKLNFIAILVLLVGFPAASYYYMKNGWDYRVKAIETQGDFGKMPNLNHLVELKGELPNQLRGSMAVVGWLDENQPAVAEKYGRTLDTLFQQFKDSPNLYFTTITNADVSYIEDWMERYNLPDDQMLSFLESEGPLGNTATAFQLPAEAGTEPIVAMVDSSLTIRKFYDLEQREEAIGLVQLISLIIPLPEKADVIMAPKKEL